MALVTMTWSYGAVFICLNLLNATEMMGKLPCWQQVLQISAIMTVVTHTFSPPAGTRAGANLKQLAFRVD